MARGGKGKGILIHTLTDAAGMPLANRTTPANGNEQAQVLPLLEPPASGPASQGVLGNV